MSNGLWVTPSDLGSDLSSSAYAMEACETASFILWGMSGRKFSGVSTVTERYMTQERSTEERRYLAAAAEYVLPRAAFVLSTGETIQNKIRLRGTPVQSVASVTTVRTGTLVAESTYDLWDHTFLLFPGGVEDDLDIVYTYGVLPPAAGKMAAREMAKQFALLWSGREDECTLPSRVTNVSRQGVSWVLLDQQDFIAELRTGIYSVDLFLKTVNPDQARAKAKVFSYDKPQGNRKTPRI